MKRAYVVPFLASVLLLLQPEVSRSAGTPRPINAEAKAKLQSLAGEAENRFLAYRSTFQLGQIDRHVKLLNAALQPCTKCRSALQSQIAAVTTLRAGIVQTMRPVTQLGQTLVGHAPGVPMLGTSGISGHQLSCPAPQISSLSVNQGQPGDPVVVNGSGFGTSANFAAILFIGSGGKSYAMSATSWTDGQILAYVPAFTGVQAFPAFIQVLTPLCTQNTSTQKSNVVPFQFNPEPDTIQLSYSASDAAWASFWCLPDVCQSWPGYLCAAPQACDLVEAGGLSGQKGDDQFFTGYQLINGWVLASVDLQNAAVVTKSNGCSIGSDSIGSTSPYVDVHCWVSPVSGRAGYVLSIYITGPTGVSYR